MGMGMGMGIDIGSGNDPLSKWTHAFPLMTGCVAWDKPQGDAQHMDGVKDDQYDFVHSSHCLEHLESPVAALRNWIRITKPGGHVVVTVPDMELYEGGRLPSRYNGDHKWMFTLSNWKNGIPQDKVIPVVGLLAEASVYFASVSIERLLLVRDFWNPLHRERDQTLNACTESCIEFVLRKN